MNLPAVAKQTYDRLKGIPAFLKITKKLMKRLCKTRDPLRRTRIVYREIDKSLEKLFCDPVVAQNITCSQGCSSCCHTQVSITKDEANTLAHLVLMGHHIDLRKLYIQAQAQNSAGQWYKIPYSLRGCVFLNSKGECSIYNMRPSVCRTNCVVSDAEHCSTENGEESSIRLLKTEEADMLIMGAFMFSIDNGSLPYMLHRALLQRNELDRPFLNLK